MLLILSMVFTSVNVPVVAADSNVQDNKQEEHTYQNPVADEDGNVTWDTIWFGNYWQNDTNGDGTADRSDKQELIKWRVLSVDEEKNTALLLSDKALDAKFYNTEEANVIWYDCTLRSWLNSYDENANAQGIDYSTDGFLTDAFSPYEQDAIVTTSLDNDNYDEWWGQNGNNEGIATEDKVFLISLEDLTNSDYGFLGGQEGYFGYPTKMAKPTNYAIDNECYVETYEGLEGNCCWWLRLRGGYAVENELGNVDTGAPNVASTGDPYVAAGVMTQNGLAFGTSGLFAVRPAITLDLSATDCYYYAGTVCSDGSQLEVDPYEGEYGSEGVELNHSTLTMKVGETTQLIATLTKEFDDPTIYWTVGGDNKDAVSVEDGLVTALAEGEAIVTAYVMEGESISEFASCLVTVLPEEEQAENISVDILWFDDEPTLVATFEIGKTEQFTVRINNLPNGADDGVVWTSGDEEIITIDEEGNITPLSEGKTTITVSTKYTDTKHPDGYSTSCQVYIYKPAPVAVESVSISYNGKTVSVDDVVNLSLRNDITLVASVSPNNATNKNVIWDSANKRVATISANGTEAVLTGVGVGNTIISVKTEDGEYTALCNVSVNVVSVDSVAIAYKGKTVSYNELTLNKGNSLSLDAVINPSNASDKTVSWNSSDTKIATISANGKVVAVSAGNAVITVSSNDGGKTASCNITVVSGNGTDSASENKTPSSGGESGNNPGGSEGKEEKVYKVEVTYGENGLVSANRAGSVSDADVSEVSNKGNDSSFEVKVKEDKDVSFLVIPDAEYGIATIKVAQGEYTIEEVSGNAVKSDDENIVISAKDSAGNITVTIKSMSANATLEVSFKRTTYSASINVIGDETIALKVVDGILIDESGKELKELPQPVKTGEIFDGWVTEDGTEVTMDNIVEVISAGKLIQARWAFVNVIVKQKVDIRALMNISVNDIYNIKKYQVMYQGVKNSKYASITSKGVLTAKKVEADGKPITVQVVALDRSGRTLGGCNVTIVSTKADTNKVLAANASMNQIGATYDMNALLASSLPKNSYDKITWSVPKGCKVASINEKGILTALDKSGKVKVTAEFVNTSEMTTVAKNRTAKVTFTIAVKLPKQAAKKTSVKVSKEKTLKLSNLSGQTVEWSVDKEASVKLVEKGTDSKGVNSIVVTGVKADTVKVTAYVNGDKQHPYVYEVTVK